jgi:hypothetical protein
MAETKARASSSGGAKAKSKRAKPQKSSASEANPGGSNGTVGEAGRSVARAAQKAKTPLLAGGAAIVGAAGGLALGTRRERKSKLARLPKVKIRSKDLAKAARSAGQLGMEVNEIATELRRKREQTNGSNRRSPVEVVLEGLTHRGGSS